MFNKSIFIFVKGITNCAAYSSDGQAWRCMDHITTNERVSVISAGYFQIFLRFFFQKQQFLDQSC